MFGDAVGSTWFFHFSTDGRLGAIHLGHSGGVHSGAGPQADWEGRTPPTLDHRELMVFMARPPLSIGGVLVPNDRVHVPKGARISFGNISGTLSPHSRNLGLDACSSVT